MLDEIITVVPFRDLYFIVYKSGRVIEMRITPTFNDTAATFRTASFEIPRSFS